MIDVRDYELRKTVAEPPDLPPGRSAGFWVAAAVLLIGIGVAAYIVFFGGAEGSRPETATRAAVPAARPGAEPQPLGGEAAPIDVPPLAETDALVRDLVGALSSHPRVAAWLATDDLIRNFTVVVANIADGRTPARHLTALRPPAEFRVVERGEDLFIDPRSYARYDGLAAAAASLDPAGSAKLYATLKPRIEEAYRELGIPDTPFDRTLERALVVLLATPVVEDPVPVEPRGIGFAFTSPQLEGLTASQRQLLRTGPRNVRLVQASLRELALALGIPAERLPAPRPQI
jgi:hypothetical protein